MNRLCTPPSFQQMCWKNWTCPHSHQSTINIIFHIDVEAEFVLVKGRGRVGTSAALWPVFSETRAHVSFGTQGKGEIWVSQQRCVCEKHYCVNNFAPPKGEWRKWKYTSGGGRSTNAWPTTCLNVNIWWYAFKCICLETVQNYHRLLQHNGRERWWHSQRWDNLFWGFYFV